MMFGIAEWIIVVSIVAFLYLLFRYGARPVVMMIMGGVSLVFLAGLLLVLVFSARMSMRDSVRQDVESVADHAITFRSSPTTDAEWDGPRAYGPRGRRFVPMRPPRGFDYAADSEFIGGHSVGFDGSDDWDRPSGTRQVAEVQTAVDPLIADAAVVSDGDSSGESESPNNVASAIDAEPPAWVDQPAGKVAGGAYVVTTEVGPFKTLQEAESMLTIEVEAATNRHIDRDIGRPGAAGIVDLPPRYIYDRIVTDTWQEKFDHETFGPMMNLHARLQFDDAFHREIKDRYANAIVAGRLIGGGVAASALLLLLATVYGYLKLDTATKGYYSGRLRVAAAAMILTTVTIGVMLFRTVVWL